MQDQIPTQVREYFRTIGAKGGAAGRGTALRRELSSRAAIIRWRKRHPRPKNPARTGRPKKEEKEFDSRSAPANVGA